MSKALSGLKGGLEMRGKKSESHAKGLVVPPGKGVGSHELISFEAMLKNTAPSAVEALVKFV